MNNFTTIKNFLLPLDTNCDNTFHRTPYLPETTRNNRHWNRGRRAQGVSRVRHAFTPFSSSSQQPTFAQVRLISTCLARNTAQHRPASLYLVSASPLLLPSSSSPSEEKVASEGVADAMVEGLGVDARPRPIPGSWKRRLRPATLPPPTPSATEGVDWDGKRVTREPVAGRTLRADVSKLPQRRDTPRRPCHREPFGLSK